MTKFNTISSVGFDRTNRIIKISKKKKPPKIIPYKSIKNTPEYDRILNLLKQAGGIPDNLKAKGWSEEDFIEQINEIDNFVNYAKIFHPNLRWLSFWEGKSNEQRT